MRGHREIFLAKTVNMRPCDYQILEYTNSELRTHGVPFIVVLRIHLQDSFALNGYVLRNWRAKIEAASECELDDVENFLQDLRHHSRTSKTPGASFFDQLDNLSVGPVRALVSGSCLLSDLETVLPMFFEGELQTSTWQTSFDIVSEETLASLESAKPRV
jgi:hypothetical protein